MPPRKFRKSRKPTVARAKRVVTKQRKQKAKLNMDTYFLKTKSLFNIAPTQGVSVSNYIYNVYTLDPLGVQSQYLNNAEFQLWRLQYDKFRVNSVKVTFTPKSNVLDQVNAQNDALLNVTGDGMIHTCLDRDGSAPSSTAMVSRYPSYKPMSIMKTWSRSYSVKYPTGVWIDCDMPQNFRMGKELGLTGGITMYAENFLEDNAEIFNEPIAEVKVEYNIVFQGKTSNSLSGVYDDLGNLTGVTINASDPTLWFPLSPLTNVRGLLDADTRTENEITETKITDLGIPM